jgi:hypothetical protein
MELRAACSNKKMVIPLMLEDFQLPDEVSFMQLINRVFRSWFDSAEECAGELAEAYAKYLDSCKAGSITQEQTKQEEPSKEDDRPENENQTNPSPAENISKPRKQGFFGSLLSRRKKK